MVYVKNHVPVRARHKVSASCEMSTDEEMPNDGKIVQEYLYSISMMVKKFN